MQLKIYLLVVGIGVHMQTYGMDFGCVTMNFSATFDHQKSMEYRFLLGLKRSLLRRFLRSLHNPQKAQEASFQRILHVIGAIKTY